jgi:hypothetical protein
VAFHTGSFNQILAIYTNLSDNNNTDKQHRFTTNTAFKAYTFCLTKRYEMLRKGLRLHLLMQVLMSNSYLNPRHRFRHFIRTNEFIDDLEDTMDGEDLSFANPSYDWDQEIRDILDLEEDEADYESDL